jgi:5'-3' exoribonuclease 2
MYVNVMRYVDRIFAAVRPRRLLFLAIDGIAPRAKMNQQRVRRFRSAQEARERQEAKEETRRYHVYARARIIGRATIPSEGPSAVEFCASNVCGAPSAARRELVGEGYDLTTCDDDEAKSEWDSNVITPGTEFMYKLGEYLRFYIADRINHNPAWRNIKARPSPTPRPSTGHDLLTRPCAFYAGHFF